MTLWQDIRFGIRTLRKDAGFTAVAVLTLALGIGANTSIFSVVNSVLLRPIPIKDPERIVVVNQRMPNHQSNVFTTPAYVEWKEQSGLTNRMAASIPKSFSLSGNQQAERIRGARVSANYFPVLGVSPIRGRTFTELEDKPGGGNVAVLSYDLWQQRFNRDENVLGRTLTLDGADYIIIGVMGPDFDLFGAKVQLWVPLQLAASDSERAARNVHWLTAFARLDAGVTKSSAQAQLDTIASRIHKQNPDDDAGWGADLYTLREYNTGSIQPALLVLLGCVGFVLLIACANIANLLLARGAARRKEIAIRIAIGAGRGRIVRQLLTESMLLAVLGGGLALLIAYGGIQILVHMNPASIPGVEEVAMDRRVLLFTLAISMLGGALFGLVPAIQGSRVDSNTWLKEGARGSSGNLGAHRSVLVAAQIGMALMLLIGAGLLLKDLWLLRGVAPGFNSTGVLTLRVSVPQANYSVTQIPLFYKQVLEKTSALPGVASAALARDLPMAGTDPSMPVQVEGRPPEDLGGESIVTRFRAISPNYFHTLGIPLLSGREFLESDTVDSEAVAIISQTLAREYWPKESPLGKRIIPNLPGARWCTIVGVVADVRHWSADVPLEPTAYYPFTQVPAGFLPLLENSMAIAVRTTVPPGSLTSSIRAAIRSVSPDAPIFGVQTLEQLYEDSGSLRRFNLSLLGVFAALALTLAAIGIYGVVAFTVAQRTREIGIRLAYGAQPSDVLRMILLQSSRLVIIGVVAGIAAAAALARVMESLLAGVNSRDPLTFITVAIVVTIAALLASYIPARRAMKVDPIVALRCE